ncbi:MAG: hypothetical protein PHF67_05065 [Candidatus Nanoarchaeia archaeon]|nr:hypothetical protein [Candidatus Nanoarchaeia archaeon]
MVKIDLSKKNYRGNRRFLRDLGIKLLGKEEGFLEAGIEGCSELYLDLSATLTLNEDYINYSLRIRIDKGGAYKEVLNYETLSRGNLRLLRELNSID